MSRRLVLHAKCDALRSLLLASGCYKRTASRLSSTCCLQGKGTLQLFLELQELSAGVPQSFISTHNISYSSVCCGSSSIAQCCHFTEKFSELMIFSGASVHEMAMSVLIPLGTSAEVGHSFLPLWTAFLPILHGQDKITQWYWLSAVKRSCIMRHGWGEMMQWYHEGGIFISCWDKQMSSWAPPLSPAFLDLFTVLFVIQPFEAPGICLFFLTAESCSHLHIIPCLNFPNQCLDRCHCFARKTGDTFLLRRISEAFLRGRKYAVFFEKHTDYLKSDHGMGRDRNTVCRKYNIQVGQPTQCLTVS